METNNAQGANKEKYTNRKRNTIIAICIIIIIIILLLRSCGGGAVTEDYNPDIDPDAVQWSGEVSYGADTATSQEESTITVPGYPYIYMSAGQTTANITLWNPEGNPCYFIYEITLADTGEVLYTSKQIAPGTAVTQEDFNRSLSAGQYDAVITITTAAVTDGSAMNSAKMSTILTVG